MVLFCGEQAYGLLYFKQFSVFCHINKLRANVTWIEFLWVAMAFGLVCGMDIVFGKNISVLIGRFIRFLRPNSFNQIQRLNIILKLPNMCLKSIKLCIRYDISFLTPFCAFLPICDPRKSEVFVAHSEQSGSSKRVNFILSRLENNSHKWT